MDANLKQGVEIEKEHRNLYIELSNRLLKQGIKMPMTETEFFTWIAKAHIAENKDYYPQLLKYVEKEHDDLIDKTVRVKNIDTPGKVHFKNDEGYFVKFPGGFDAYFQADQLTPIQQKFETGGGIGFIPMHVEEKIENIMRWGDINEREVIEILNAMIDAGLTDDDLKTPPTKTGTQYEKAQDKLTQDIWQKIQPFYKGDLKGNRYYSAIKKMVYNATSLNTQILKEFKPYRSYQKFETGGSLLNYKDFKNHKDVGFEYLMGRQQLQEGQQYRTNAGFNPDELYFNGVKIPQSFLGTDFTWRLADVFGTDLKLNKEADVLKRFKDWAINTFIYNSNNYYWARYGAKPEKNFKITTEELDKVVGAIKSTKSLSDITYKVSHQKYAQGGSPNQTIYLNEPVIRPESMASDFPVGEYELVKEYDNQYLIKHKNGTVIKLNKSRFSSPTSNNKQPNIQTTPMIYQTKFNELKSAIEATPGFTKHEQPAELKSLEAWSASYHYNDCHIIIHFGNGTNKLQDNQLKFDITQNYGSNGLGAHRGFEISVADAEYNADAIILKITTLCHEINAEVAEKVDARLQTEIALLNQAKAEVKGDKPTKRERVNISSVLNMINGTMYYKPEFYPEFAKLVLESGVKYTINPYNEYDGNTEVADWLKSINKNVLDFLPVKEYSLPKYKPFDTVPDDKTFMAIHAGFAGDEDIRPNLLGSNFGPHGVVTTDAMQLLFTKYNTTGVKNGNYCHTKKCFDNEDAVEQAKYPNWAAIVPHGSSIKWHLNAHALINALKNIIALDLLPNFAKYICLTGLTAIDNTIVFDAKALLSCIEAMVKLGHTDLEMGWSAPNRAALIYPKGNANKIQPGSTNASFETDFALIMPRILNDGSAGDPYFNVDTNCVTFDKTDAPYCFDATVTESKKIQAREQALATELENSKAQIEELKKQNAKRDAELVAQQAEAEAKRQALAAAADAKRKQEIDNKHLGNIEALARKIKTKKQAKEAISKARAFTPEQINDTIAGNMVVLETMPDGPAKQALHDYTEGLRVMVDTDNVYADGGAIYSLAENMSDTEYDEKYSKLSKKQKDKVNSLIRLGDAPKLALATTLLSKEIDENSDTWNLHRYSKGGGVKGKLKPGVYKVGKPIKLSPILYEQKIAEVNDDGSVSQASNYARKLVILNTEHKNYPLISEADVEMQKSSVYAKGGTVGKIKASAKDIQSIEHLVDFSVRGNSHQLPYDGEVERMLEDHRMFLNDKEFFDKYGDKIGSHPDADEFDEEFGSMEEFRITDQYYITFKDGSEIVIDFDPVSYDFIYANIINEDEAEGTMAQKYEPEFSKNGWDMDITALEEFVKTGKFASGGKVTNDLFLLKSVGTYINKQTGDTYAAFKDGSYDDNNPVNVLDIEVDEWFDALSPADKKVVNAAKKQASKFATGGPILRNGKESYEVGDEGMFEGGEVVVKKVTKTTYVFSYLNDAGEPFNRKFTVPKKQFEKQFAYFPKK